MPPKPKLHNKHGKAKSFPKSLIVTPEPSTSTDEPNVEDNERKFEVELLWCIQQLENALENRNINPKQGEESMKVLKVLKSNTQPTVRKRQLMRQHFGDYRAKMAAEEKKAKKAGNKMSIASVTPSTSKSTFIRKSATLTLGDNTFRFNFAPPATSADTSTNNSDSQSNGKQENLSESETKVNNGMESTSLENSIKKLNFSSDSFKFNFDIDGKT